MKKSLLLFGFALPAFSSFSQVVYTDINPDTTINIPYQQYNLDLNNDGTSDFAIKWVDMGGSCGGPCGSASSYGIVIYATTANEVLRDSFGMVRPLNTGDSISNYRQVWSSYGNIAVPSFGCNQISWSCVFNGINGWPLTERCAGLRVKTGSQYIYGWVRIIKNAINSYSIKDYAYNSIPDSMLYACSTLIGIDDINQNGILGIFPNPFHFTTAIHLNNSSLHSTLKIYNTLGSLVREQTINGQSAIINREGLENGIYFIRVSDGEHECVGKIVVE